jgi:hypothetical protein
MLMTVDAHDPENTPAIPPPRSPPPEPARKHSSSFSPHPSTSGVVDTADNINYSGVADDVPCDSFEQVDSLIDELVERARAAFEHEMPSESSEIYLGICYF